MHVVHPKLTLDQRAYIVYLRFGSLTDDSNVVRSYKEVSRLCGIRTLTCERNVAIWRRDGCVIRNNFKGCP